MRAVSRLWGFEPKEGHPTKNDIEVFRKKKYAWLTFDPDLYDCEMTAKATEEMFRLFRSYIISNCQRKKIIRQLFPSGPTHVAITVLEGDVPQMLDKMVEILEKPDSFVKLWTKEAEEEELKLAKMWERLEEL